MSTSTSKSKVSVAASKTAVQSTSSTTNGSISKSAKTGTAASKAASTSNPSRVSTTAVVSRTSVVKQPDNHWVTEFDDNLDASIDNLKTEADATEDIVSKKQDIRQKIAPSALPKKSLKNAKIHIAEEEDRKESATTAQDESEIPSTINNSHPSRKPDNGVKIVRANSRKCGGPQTQVFITFAVGFLIGGGGGAGLYIAGIL